MEKNEHMSDLLQKIIDVYKKSKFQCFNETFQNEHQAFWENGCRNNIIK